MYGYNSAMQESSRYTPFEAMFGRLAKLPVDFNTSESWYLFLQSRKDEKASISVSDSGENGAVSNA